MCLVSWILQVYAVQTSRGLAALHWAHGTKVSAFCGMLRVSVPLHRPLESHHQNRRLSAAQYVAKLKHDKYSALEPMYDFVLIAVDTAGTWGIEAMEFERELGRRLR